MKMSSFSGPRYPIGSLPLPPSSHILTRNLNPEPNVPNVNALREALKTHPSILRRSRLVPSAHFTFNTPFPIQFPYRIPSPSSGESRGQLTQEHIEEWLSTQEPLEERPLASDSTNSEESHKTELGKYSSPLRDQKRELIALAPTCLEDCLPSLDIGDSLEYLGKPSLLGVQTSNGTSPADESKQAIRNELVDVLSGHSVLMSIPPPNEDKADAKGYAPWSLRYGGHQFGVWAGQLGDGRALSILEVPHPNDNSLTYELQLKGAGRTPFSRTADGLAVLRSSVREFLCSEAMHALHIPTTRSLSLISIPSLPVVRETIESASIITRVAPSFLRIGSFEILNPPADVIYLFSASSSATTTNKEDWEGMRKLGEWVSRKVLGLGLKEGEPWGKELVLEVARRNAVMVAGWQAYGFMHGVINTDNISVLGLTIDYGPYAFMDVFSRDHICNHSDAEGRYSYKLQPTMIIYALRALLKALAPLIGAEKALGRAVPQGWASEAPKGQIGAWKEEGLEIGDEVEILIQAVFAKEYHRLMRKRLSLKREDAKDKDLISSLLDVMEKHSLDFHTTFRTLTSFRPSLLRDEGDALEKYLQRLTTGSTKEDAPTDWLSWLDKYETRIESEKDLWESKGADQWLEAREKYGKLANPRFVLRQWLLEEVIKALEEDIQKGRPTLLKVLEMATKPYGAWGGEDDPRSEDELDPEVKEERRFCGIGSPEMLGFQCSCSS